MTINVALITRCYERQTSLAPKQISWIVKDGALLDNAFLWHCYKVTTAIDLSAARGTITASSLHDAALRIHSAAHVQPLGRQAPAPPSPIIGYQYPTMTPSPTLCTLFHLFLHLEYFDLPPAFYVPDAVPDSIIRHPSLSRFSKCPICNEGFLYPKDLLTTRAHPRPVLIAADYATLRRRRLRKRHRLLAP